MYRSPPLRRHSIARVCRKQCTVTAVTAGLFRHKLITPMDELAQVTTELIIKMEAFNRARGEYGSESPPLIRS